MRASAERVYFFPNGSPQAIVSNSINPGHPDIRFPSICGCRDEDRTRDVQLWEVPGSSKRRYCMWSTSCNGSL